MGGGGRGGGGEDMEFPRVLKKEYVDQEKIMKKITFYGYLISRFGNCKAIHEYLISLFL